MAKTGYTPTDPAVEQQLAEWRASSDAPEVPVRFRNLAFAIKAAIIGFTKSIASAYAAKNIRCNVLAPALIETPMAGRAAQDVNIQQFIKTKQPLDGGRIGQPSDLDGAAVYFMSEASRFTTGQVLAVDGGWCVSEGQFERQPTD